MRFMVIVKANEDSEAGILPDAKILTAMGKYNEELIKAGVMLAGEGLQASSKGARVKFEGTKRTVTDGPFSETKESPPAVRGLRPDPEAGGANPLPGDLEGPALTPGLERITERETTMRYMCIYRPGKETTTPPSQREMEEMGKFIDEMYRSGSLIATGGLEHSATGVRVRKTGDRFTVTDGPFAEAKELIAGYAIIEAKSKAEAIALTKRFLRVAGEGESEVRPLHEAQIPASATA